MEHMELFVSVTPGTGCQIALLDEKHRLEDYFQQSEQHTDHVGNIYRAIVRRVEPSVQAVFVDIGLKQNAFLHISDLHPRYFPKNFSDPSEDGETENSEDNENNTSERVGFKIPRRHRPPIQDCLHKGDEVLVQVIKEGIGTKGPTVSSYLSIPGRFLVLLPWMNELGVSKKVEDWAQRDALRKMLRQLDPPKDVGMIIRTNAIGETPESLKKDMGWLQRTWANIERKRQGLKGIGELFAESDLITRTLREIMTPQIKRIVVDDLVTARRARDFLDLSGSSEDVEVLYYEDNVPLFHRYGIAEQVASLHQRSVPLPSGGALVIDSTEAMVTVDVNSGRSRRAQDAETNALQTNLEALDEIVRQLRLRDLGGIVALDLIDMVKMGNRRKVEKRMNELLKTDRAKSRVDPISSFGVMLLTRQRMRASVDKDIHRECPHCVGRGILPTPSGIAKDVLLHVASVIHRKDIGTLLITVPGEVALILLNDSRKELSELEKRTDKRIEVRVGGGIEAWQIDAYQPSGARAKLDDQTDHTKSYPETTATTLRQIDDPSLPEIILPENHDELEEILHAQAGHDPEEVQQRQERATKRQPKPKPQDTPADAEQQELISGLPENMREKRFRLGELAEALGCSVQGLINLARRERWERLQNPNTRMKTEEVALIYKWHKDGKVIEPSENDSPPTPAQSEQQTIPDTMRTHAFAKSIDKTSKELIALIQELDLGKFTASSNLTGDIQLAVQRHLNPPKETPKETPKTNQRKGNRTIRLHELAKELLVSTREALRLAKTVGFNRLAPVSRLKAETEAKIRAAILDASDREKQDTNTPSADVPNIETAEENTDTSPVEAEATTAPKKSTRRSRKKPDKSESDTSENNTASASEDTPSTSDDTTKTAPKKRVRRTRKKASTATTASNKDKPEQEAQTTDKPVKKTRAKTSKTAPKKKAPTKTTSKTDDVEAASETSAPVRRVIKKRNAPNAKPTKRVFGGPTNRRD